MRSERVRFGTSSSISSPLRTRANGPPTADSGETWSTTVPYDVPLMRAFGDAHHVLDASAEQLGRDRRGAPFGHAGRAARPDLLEDEHRRLVDGEVGIVDAPVQVLMVLEDHGSATVNHQVSGRRRLL